MKKLSILFVFVLSLGLFGQKPSVDTAQVVTNRTSNSAETLSKPYVILISIDGMRYDYMKKYHAEHLLNLAQKGVWAEKGMLPSYPSITFPNHYSIVTGLYPAHHGIVNNVFYDPQREELYRIGSKTIEDGSWYGGEPLWNLAESQGMKSASLFWVGSESDVDGRRPSYYYRYHEQFDGTQKAAIIKHWLELPVEKRPHMITLYFPEVDHAGHAYGPDARQTEESVHYIDQSIETLVKTLEPLGLPINYILVSDHGMIAVDPKDYVSLPAIDKDKFVVVNAGTMTLITAKNPQDVRPLYKQLKKGPHKNYKIYLASKFPKRLHFSTRENHNRRIGDIILVPKKAKLMVDTDARKPSVGKHGFDPRKVPEMKATFMAWGPAFKEPETVLPFENIHIYPMVAEILGLKITQPIDGKEKVLDKILKK